MNADMKESLMLIGVEKSISTEDFILRYKIYIDMIESKTKEK